MELKKEEEEQRKATLRRGELLRKQLELEAKKELASKQQYSKHTPPIRPQAGFKPSTVAPKKEPLRLVTKEPEDESIETLIILAGVAVASTLDDDSSTISTPSSASGGDGDFSGGGATEEFQ